MGKYKISVEWRCSGIIEVKAENIHEAMKQAHAAPLPEGEYIDDSFIVDDLDAQLELNE